jgi:nicotinamidase-related amidase
MKRTVLLVIDLQPGAFDGVRWSVISEPDRLIGNALALVTAVRRSSRPVIFVQHCEGAGEVFEEGTVHGQLHESLAPLPLERVLKKRASSAFEATDLEATLRDFEAEELVLCGLQSEFCVANTAKSALALGFRVIVAADGHSTWPTQDESASTICARINEELQTAGATLRSTAELVRTYAEAQPEREGGKAR